MLRSYFETTRPKEKAAPSRCTSGRDECGAEQRHSSCTQCALESDGRPCQPRQCALVVKGANSPVFGVAIIRRASSVPLYVRKPFGLVPVDINDEFLWQFLAAMFNVFDREVGETPRKIALGSKYAIYLKPFGSLLIATVTSADFETSIAGRFLRLVGEMFSDFCRRNSLGSDDSLVPGSPFDLEADRIMALFASVYYLRRSLHSHKNPGRDGESTTAENAPGVWERLERDSDTPTFVPDEPQSGDDTVDGDANSGHNSLESERESHQSTFANTGSTPKDSNDIRQYRRKRIFRGRIAESSGDCLESKIRQQRRKKLHVIVVPD